MISITKTPLQIFLQLSLAWALGFLAYNYSATRAVQVTVRSTEFKAMIERGVRDLDAAGKIHSNGLYPRDVTDLVLPFIPIGTTFDDAEAFLRRTDSQFLQDERTPTLRIYFL